MQTILVVEDDEVMHKALAGLLELEGYEVIGARCLRDAASYLEQCAALDGAIVDWMLGDETSDAVLEELMDLGIATILLSAHPVARSVAAGYGIPCVHKPFNVEQLLGIVSGTMSRQTLRKIALSRG